MVTSNIIIDRYDASANNAILEASANAPIFTRTLRARDECFGKAILCVSAVARH